MKTRLAALLAVLAAPASAQVTMDQVREEIRKELSAARTSGGAAVSAFNPAMGVVLDAVGKHTRGGRGHLEFRGAELNLQADVDPRAKMYAIVNAASDEVELEEAAAVFHSLPGNLSLRAGRYFADFGRFPKWHTHELPFVERAESLDSIGGESKTDGLEASHLFALPFFLRATAGVGNKLGAENTRLEETSPAAQDGHKNGRPLSAFTYYGKLATFAELGDEWGADLSVSEAYTPRQFYVGGVRTEQRRTQRALTGAELTVRWEPRGEASYRRLTWGTEAFHNNERRRIDPDGLGASFLNARRTAWSGYSYVDWRFARTFSAGGLVDYAENLDDRRTSTRTFGGFVNVHLSEFNKLRLQVDRRRDNAGGRADTRGFVQLVAIIGTHAHRFKDR